MPMNDTNVVTFSAEDTSHPQLLDSPPLATPQECLGSLNVDQTSHVFSDVLRQGLQDQTPSRNCELAQSRRGPTRVPTLFKAAEGALDRDVIAMREKRLQWLSVALANAAAAAAITSRSRASASYV
jgi:hypothetical protein